MRYFFILSTEEWQKIPSMITRESTQPCWLKEANESSLILGINHFCPFTVSGNLECNRKIRLYMQPSQIEDSTDGVNVFLFAVQKCHLDVSTSPYKYFDKIKQCCYQYKCMIVEKSRVISNNNMNLKP